VSIPTQSTFKRELQSIDPSVFEQFVADVWDARGWTTRVTRDSTDRGVDVVATQQTPFRQKQIIQAKRYSDTNPVGSPEVQQYASLRQQENADAVIIVTSGRFSKQAESVARDLSVKLVDGDDLYDLISSSELSSITDEYLDSDGEDNDSESDDEQKQDSGPSRSSSTATSTSPSSANSEPVHTAPPTAGNNSSNSTIQNKPQAPTRTTITPSQDESVVHWLFRKRTGLMRGMTGFIMWLLVSFVIVILAF
jgi:hypothetical protein